MQNKNDNLLNENKSINNKNNILSQHIIELTTNNCILQKEINNIYKF